ncbi:hypothetical protein FOZ60_007644 [Perkinsus olseni]|uniref:Uncharacterized protein n=1 Tax=Perkinsus olseni TaxID=32597 RepID=A0A7J6NLS5_PEROL|nr:hypothetical protein FOZ60_007644 [Perkinsus olseni]
MVSSSSAEQRSSCVTACIERLKSTFYQEGRSTVFEETRRAVLIDTVANGGFNPGRCLAVLQDQGLLAQYRRRLAFEIDDHQFRAQKDASLEEGGHKAERDALSAAHRRLSEIVLANLRQHLSKVTRDRQIEMGPIISMEDIYIALVSARGNQVEDVDTLRIRRTMEEVRDVFSNLDCIQSHSGPQFRETSGWNLENHCQQLILMSPVHDGFDNHTNNGHDSGGLVPPILREYFHNNSGSHYFRVLPVNPSEGPKGVQEVVKKLVDMKNASLRHEIPTNPKEFTTGHSAETMDQVRLIPILNLRSLIGEEDHYFRARGYHIGEHPNFCWGI